jgi:hypothetical protein
LLDNPKAAASEGVKKRTPSFVVLLKELIYAAFAGPAANIAAPDIARTAAILSKLERIFYPLQTLFDLWSLPPPRDPGV